MRFPPPKQTLVDNAAVAKRQAIYFLEVTEIVPPVLP